MVNSMELILNLKCQGIRTSIANTEVQIPPGECQQVSRVKINPIMEMRGASHLDIQVKIVTKKVIFTGQ